MKRSYNLLKLAIVGLFLLVACRPVAESPGPGTTPVPTLQQSTIQIEEGIAPVNGVELYYKVMGAGDPVIILHGGPGLDHTYLLPQMARLADNYRLIFYDQRASGRSSGRVDASSITIDNFVEDLEGLRQALALDQINLMGHSWGGLLAMYYAIKYPQHLNSLILVGSAGASWEFRSVFGANLQQRMTEDDLLLLNALEASEDFGERRPEVMEAFFKGLFKLYFHDRALSGQLTIQLNEQTARNNLLVNPLMWHNLGRYDIHDQLAAIGSPTLIIHGDDDPVPLEYAQKIHEHIPGSEFVLLENCGHFPYIERPEMFFNIVSRFLERGGG